MKKKLFIIRYKIKKSDKTNVAKFYAFSKRDAILKFNEIMVKPTLDKCYFYEIVEKATFKF